MQSGKSTSVEYGSRLGAGGPGRPSQPARIGKYEIETAVRIEKHARIEVFRAHDRDIGRPVTLKLVAAASDKQLADRFRREVSSVAKLRVANVVAIYELGEHAGLPFAALQHLGDDHLGLAITGHRKLHLLQKMLIMEQVATGVAEAHRGGLEYVGIRPAAIALAADGGATIQDFGIVRFTGAKLDEGGLYRAPEQATAGFEGDSLCDVFAFGVVCYEFLTNSHPFRDGDAKARDWRQRPASLRELLAECPEGLERLIARCLEIGRELRYPSFDEIRDDLRPILQGLKRARASELWANGRQLVDAQRLDEAQGVVREAVQLNPDDPNGNQISADLRVLLQRQKVRARVEELWRQADESAGNRRFFAAVDILESAARLEPRDAETQARLEKMRTRLSHSVASAQLVVEARLLAEQHKLEAAREQVLKAIECDEGDPDAPGLLETIQKALERRATEARAEEGIAKAKSLVLRRSFDEALAILAGLHAENPDSALIAQWIGHVETQKKEAERQGHLQKVSSEAEALLLEQRFAETVALIESAESEFPGEVVLADLRRRAHEGSERTRVLELGTRRCTQFCQEHKFGQALSAVDEALAALPGEPTLLALRSQVEAQAAGHTRAAAVREALEEIQWLLDQDRPDLAIRFLKERCTGMAAEAALTSRRADLERILPDWEQRRFFEVIEDLSCRRDPEGGSAKNDKVLLTVLEEALTSCAPGDEVAEAANRLRNVLREQALITEVRQQVAAGDAELAEQALQRGLEFLRDESLLDSLQQEIEACKKFVDERWNAQVLVGMRQYGEAEAILQRLAGPSHPEIQSLSELVRALRDASDEKVFCERVGETALLLAREGRFEEADRIFQRLMTLFPGDPALQKSRASLGAGATEARQPEAVRVAAPPVVPREPLPFPTRMPPPGSHRPRFSAPKVAVVSGGLLLAGAGAALLRPSHAPSATPVKIAAAVKQETQRPVEPGVQSVPATIVPANVVVDKPPEPVRRAADRTRTERSSSRSEITEQAEPASHREFQPPSRTSSRGDRAQNVDLPAPPNSASVEAGRDAPAALLAIGQGLASAPPPPPARPAPAAPAQVAAATSRGQIQQAELISAPPPAFPALARQNRVSGVVDVEATVDATGRVTSVTVARGNPLLTTAARQAVMQWRYRPARIDGNPVEAKVQVKVNFEQK
jgi:TonB family protein